MDERERDIRKQVSRETLFWFPGILVVLVCCVASIFYFVRPVAVVLGLPIEENGPITGAQTMECMALFVFGLLFGAVIGILATPLLYRPFCSKSALLRSADLNRRVGLSFLNSLWTRWINLIYLSRSE